MVDQQLEAETTEKTEDGIARSLRDAKFPSSQLEQIHQPESGEHEAGQEAVVADDCKEVYSGANPGTEQEAH
jgi:hypothetical protein